MANQRRSPYNWGGDRRPRDLERMVDRVVDAGGEIRPVTLRQRLHETLRIGGNMSDAASRCGVLVDTLREWRRIGATVAAKLVNDEAKPADLTPDERFCLEVHQVCEEAQTEGVLLLASLAQREAQGGYVRTTTRRKVLADGKVETTTITETAAPNVRMIEFLLSHRRPEDWGRTRVEITGAEGGPVKLESAVDEMLAELSRIHAAQAELGPLVAANGHDPAESGTPTH